MQPNQPVKPIAVIQLALMPSGELRAHVEGMNAERFKGMMCDGIASILPKLVENEQTNAARIQVPSPAVAAQLARVPNH